MGSETVSSSAPAVWKRDNKNGGERDRQSQLKVEQFLGFSVEMS